MPTRYAVLSDAPLVEALKSEIDKALPLLNEAIGADFRYAGREPLEGFESHVWEDEPDGEAAITLSEDRELATRSVMVEAADEPSAEEIAAALFPRLPVESLADIRQAAAGADDARALIRLALAQATAPDPESVPIFKRALGSEREDILEAALTAAIMVQSPALLPELEALVGRELSEEQRVTVAEAIAVCAEGGEAR